MWSRSDELSRGGPNDYTPRTSNFDAAAAKRMADAQRVSKLSGILEDIKNAAAMGHYAMSLPHMEYNERVAITAELEKLGFSVEHSSHQMDGDYTKVMWG